MTPSPFRRLLLFTAIPFLAILGLLLAHERRPLPPDVRWQLAAYEVRNPSLDLVARFLHYGGSVYCLVPLGLALALAYWLRGQRRIAVGILATLAATGFLLQGLKMSVSRERPDVARRLFSERGKSFPSGHAAGSAALAAIATALARRGFPSRAASNATAAALALFSLATGLSRVYAGAHYLSDVVSGWMLGLACFAGAWAWVDRGPSDRYNRTFHGPNVP